MLGAIIGDIVGSAYEFNSTNDYNFELFSEESSYTDDTICTVAIADAILKGKDYGKSLHEWCNKYPHPKGGYGERFRAWVESDTPRPYNSLGNGSAMRVSPIAWANLNLVNAMREATRSAMCTHDHREGIKGAEAVVMAIHFGDEIRRLSNHIDRDEILEKFKAVIEYTHYNINIRRSEVLNKFDETCPGTVPVALWIISESTGFEDAIRKAVSLGADADTLGAIVGSIAESIWGVPRDLAKQAMSILPFEMRDVVMKFYQQYCPNMWPIDGYGDKGAAEDQESEENFDMEKAKFSMFWKLGMGHIGRLLNGEDNMPNKGRRATIEDWKTEAMPKDYITKVPMYYELSKEKMDVLKKGHIPEAMEDHWFMYCDRSYIRYYRSWTGMCAFEAHYHKVQNNYIIDSLTMNHRLDEFGVNGEGPAMVLFLYLIESELHGHNGILWDTFLEVWEKQFHENIQESIKRGELEEDAEKKAYRIMLRDSVAKLRRERKEAREEATKDAKSFMTFDIAGTQYIKDQNLFYLFKEEDLLTLRLENNNKYDKNAVALYYKDNKVGYVPQKMNYELSQLLRQGWDDCFVAYVSQWKGCGKKRRVTIEVMIKKPKEKVVIQREMPSDRQCLNHCRSILINELYNTTGKNTDTLNLRITPEKITHLEAKEIFVFGSNKDGHHIGGAAKTAAERFGAEWGVGDGLCGQSYAISTMEGLIETAKNINRFIDFATECSDLKFYVTAIGCGIAGYTPLQIAPLFIRAIVLKNVYLPRIFWEYYWQTIFYGSEKSWLETSKDWKKWDKK